MTTHTPDIAASIKAALSQAYVFTKATEEDLQSLVQIAQWETLPAKSVLLNEGDATRSLFVLAKGRLVVKEAITPTSDLIIARIQAGDVVGELGLFDGKPASASVRADELSTVVRLDHVAVRTLFAVRPALELVFIREITRTLTQRLRNSNQIIRASLSSVMMPHV